MCVCVHVCMCVCVCVFACMCVSVRMCLRASLSESTGESCHSRVCVVVCAAEGGDVCQERNRGGNELRGLRRTHGQLPRHLPLLCVRHRHYVRASVCCSVLQSAAVCCDVMHASDTLLCVLHRHYITANVCCSVL